MNGFFDMYINVATISLAYLIIKLILLGRYAKYEWEHTGGTIIGMSAILLPIHLAAFIFKINTNVVEIDYSINYYLAMVSFIIYVLTLANIIYFLINYNAYYYYKFYTLNKQINVYEFVYGGVCSRADKEEKLKEFVKEYGILRRKNYLLNTKVRGYDVDSKGVPGFTIQRDLIPESKKAQLCDILTEARGPMQRVSQYLEVELDNKAKRQEIAANIKQDLLNNKLGDLEFNIEDIGNVELNEAVFTRMREISMLIAETKKEMFDIMSKCVEFDEFEAKVETAEYLDGKYATIMEIFNERIKRDVPGYMRIHAETMSAFIYELRAKLIDIIDISYGVKHKELLMGLDICYRKEFKGVFYPEAIYDFEMIAILLILLAGFVVLAAYLSGKDIYIKPEIFCSVIVIVHMLLIVVFTIVGLVHFFIIFELLLVPMLLLIGVWGFSR